MLLSDREMPTNFSAKRIWNKFDKSLKEQKDYDADVPEIPKADRVNFEFLRLCLLSCLKISVSVCMQMYCSLQLPASQ